jgi:hypothetical protein
VRSLRQLPPSRTGLTTQERANGLRNGVRGFEQDRMTKARQD